MKKIAALCLLLVSLSFNARADLVILENVASGGQSQEITLKIKGDMARVDLMSGAMSTIMDASTGNIISLIHSQKMYVKVSAEKAKAMMEQAKKTQGAAAADPAEPAKIVDTGKTEKVGAYNTEIYKAETATAKFTFWVTKDMPNYASVKEQMKKLQALQEKMGQKVPDTSAIDGVPVKIETIVGDKTITMTTVSVKQDPVDDASLQVPADYTEMQLPTAPPQP